MRDKYVLPVPTQPAADSPYRHALSSNTTFCFIEEVSAGLHRPNYHLKAEEGN